MHFAWVQNQSSDKKWIDSRAFSQSSHRNKISWEVFRIMSDEKEIQWDEI